MPAVIAHDDDGVDGVELHVGDLSFLPGHHRLVADGLILVDGQVKHVDLWTRLSILRGDEALATPCENQPWTFYRRLTAYRAGGSGRGVVLFCFASVGGENKSLGGALRL